MVCQPCVGLSASMFFVCISMSLLVLLCHCWLMNWINKSINNFLFLTVCQTVLCRVSINKAVLTRLQVRWPSWLSLFSRYQIWARLRSATGSSGCSSSFCPTSASAKRCRTSSQSTSSLRSAARLTRRCPERTSVIWCKPATEPILAAPVSDLNNCQ